MQVSKFTFKKYKENYDGIVIFRNDNLIYSANFFELDIDGYFFINKSKIKNIAPRDDFYNKLLEIKNIKIENNYSLNCHSTLKDIISSTQGIIGVNLPDKHGNTTLLVGYIEEIKDEMFGLRCVKLNGNINRKNLRWIEYPSIVRLQIGDRYSKSFELLHKHDGITIKNRNF